MTVLISQYTVYLFGVVIVALSVWGVVVPNRLIALVTGSMNRGSGLYTLASAPELCWAWR